MTASRQGQQDPEPALQAGRARPFLLVCCSSLALVYGQFRGNFTSKTKLTMYSDRAGLVMDPGSKVTYNGVQIGRVAKISEIGRDGKPAAKFILDIYPQYLGPNGVIPENVDAQIKATTVFGGKYVSLTTPKNDKGRRHLPRAPHREDSDQRLGRDDRDQHAVPDPHLDLGEGRPGQAEPDAERGRASADRVGRQVRAVDRQRQRGPRRRQPADAAGPPRHPTAGGAGRRLRQRRAGPAGLPQQFGDHGAHASTRSRRIWTRRCWRRPVSATPARTSSSAVDRIWRGVPPTWCPRRSCWTPTARSCSARCATTTTSSPRLRTFLGGNGYSLNTHTEMLSGLGLLLNPVSLVAAADRRTIGGLAAGADRWSAEPLHLSGEPAARQRSRRAGRSAGLLAAHHPSTSGRRRSW